MVIGLGMEVCRVQSTRGIIIFIHIGIEEEQEPGNSSKGDTGDSEVAILLLHTNTSAIEDAQIQISIIAHALETQLSCKEGCSSNYLCCRQREGMCMQFRGWI